MSAYLRSASSALEMLRPMQGHSAPPATSTTHQLAAQPRKVRLSFRKRSTDVEEKAVQYDWRFATTDKTAAELVAAEEKRAQAGGLMGERLPEGWVDLTLNERLMEHTGLFW